MYQIGGFKGNYVVTSCNQNSDSENFFLMIGSVLDIGFFKYKFHLKSFIYLNAGFTISPCLNFFSVLFLHV